jgi:DNA-binding transcriptional MerR regulator
LTEANQVTDPDPAAGVYTISVAAELAGVTVRSLRLYERHELLHPARTTGGTRRYSQDDLRRLRRITELLADGVNLPGIGKILDLEQDTHDLRTDNTALRADNTRLRVDNDNPPTQERPTQERLPPETARRRSPSRRAPNVVHRDQRSRPG